MTVERKPVAYDGLRGWLTALEAAGEVKSIDGEVDWNIELGTIARLLQGPATGPSVLFNNIKDYNKPNSRCKKVFTGALANYRRIAMMMGLPPDTHPRELVKLGRNILSGAIPPKIVPTGPCKENIVKGDAVDLFEFPAPYWNRLDGGRYMQTYGGCVTKDPETGIMNVGVYRGMIADKTHMPILMWRAQHIGHHVTAWQNGGASEVPIAIAMGVEPAVEFVAGAPVPKGICEYDVAGSIRGAPVELVKCETVDLYVPANAEIVVEGFLQIDPERLHDGGAVTPSSPATSPATRCRSRPSASPPSPTATSRSCAAPSRARCRAAIRRTPSPRRSCARRRRGTCSTAPACPASPTCGARRCRPASIC